MVQESTQQGALVMTVSYIEKLRDPRWQRKRLEILQRDNFTCQMCYDDSSCLHVHHRRYIRGREPWDCSNSMLVTLCESCHKLETDADRSENESDIILMLQDWLFASQLSDLTAALARPAQVHLREVVVAAICEAICDPELQQLLVEARFQLLEKRRCEKNAVEGS